LTEKSKIKVAKLRQFRIALTLVRACVPHPDDPKIPIQEACTAFELQVPVNQRKVTEEATQLKFMFYKQHNIQPMVFFKAVQMQRKHKQSQSHQVIAVKGLHPDQHFVFDLTFVKNISSNYCSSTNFTD
jgi:hypothetical protein